MSQQHHGTSASKTTPSAIARSTGTSARQPVRLCSLLAAMTISTGIAYGIHDVPPLQQTNLNNCGPTAAASCLKWFQQNQYPDIKTRSDSNDINDIRSQIAKDAGTNSTGTDDKKLAKAMNDLIDVGPNKKPGKYKKQLHARVPDHKDNAYKDFTFLDNEFSHNENILLRIEYTAANGKKEYHYITTRNLTGTGTTRTLEYMDPATGTTKTTTLTKETDKISLQYDGKNGRIAGIITMSPHSCTDSTATKVSGGTKITYQPYFPTHRKANDLHIWISTMECAENNFQVSGLPSGWTYKVHKVGTKCYLSIYKGSSTTDLSSGQKIEVTYTGSRKVGQWKRMVNQTTGGTDSPTDGALPRETGHSVCNEPVETPQDGPKKVMCAVAAVGPGVVTAQLDWNPSSDPTVEAYDIFNADTDEFVATTPDPYFILTDLPSDHLHSYVVTARNFDGMYSDDSDEVTLHLDNSVAPEILTGGPQVLDYRTPLASCYECPDTHGWTIEIPGANTDGKLYVTTISGSTIEPPPTGGSQHEDIYHLATDASLVAGVINCTVPYNELEVVGDEAALRVFALIGAAWVDVTTGVNVADHEIMFQLPELTTFAIFNAMPKIRGDFNRNGTVDMIDFDLFAGCVSGPSVSTNLDCEDMDLDDDYDIDVSDFGLFQLCYTEGGPANPSCLE